MSAGAALAIVLAAGVAGIGSLLGYIWFAFAGAMAASIVAFIGGPFFIALVRRRRLAEV